ncbi:MAG: matrixin family metalloprotease [Bryobacterales bacterium]|nr:matrixin family metalloprotease [Bryobacterales bacterium]
MQATRHQAIGLMLALAGSAGLGAADIHLKTRVVSPRAGIEVQQKEQPRRYTARRSHFLVQFSERPSDDVLAAFGVVITGRIPQETLVVSAPDGIPWRSLGASWVGRLEPSDKLSPALPAPEEMDEAAYLVEFHLEVEAEAREALLRDAGVERLEHPSLLSHQALVRGTPEAILRLVDWDEVAYLFPASEDLVRGEPVVGCAGAVHQDGPAGQYVKIGDGWPRPDGRALELTYTIGALAGGIPVEASLREIQRAFDAWSAAGNVTFRAGGHPAAERHIHLFFASGPHGDSYPFDGPGRVLAHTFYPAPPNPEPIAGDMHFDADENWRIGWGIDVFSVVLHELGHALGMGHSDRPGSIMYPYYRLAAGLGQDDIAGIRDLYGEPGEGPEPEPDPVPLDLRILTPAGPTITQAPSIRLEGTASGSGVTITWTNDRGGQGVASGTSAWSVAGVPLAPGANVLTVTATDDSGNRVARTVSITREAPSAPADTVRPSLAITSPGSSVVAVSGAMLTVRGLASDNVGVTRVTWENHLGSSGSATGTAIWSALVTLLPGTNRITVRAFDAAGNSAWRTLTVTRR